jgi:hypothetical protein
VIRNNFVYLSPGLLTAARTASSDGSLIAWNSPSSGHHFDSGRSSDFFDRSATLKAEKKKPPNRAASVYKKLVY